jgi:undecaprenyl-diphosphatase
MTILSGPLRRPAVRFAGRVVAGLVILVTAASAGAMAMAMMQRGWPVLEDLDRASGATMDRILEGRPVPSTVFGVVAALGGNTVMWWLATVTAAGMLLRRQPRLAAFLAVTGIGALVTGVLVKILVDRLPPDRPYPVTAARNAFPSVHAINAVVFYGALLLVFLPVIPRRLRAVSAGLVAVLVAAVGFARAVLGVQYGSDIVGGWIIGLAWLGVTTYAFRRWRAETGRATHPLADGLEPEAASVLAPQKVVHLQHPARAAAVLIACAVVVAAVVAGLGLLVARAAPGFDDAVPRWLAAHRTGGLDRAGAVLGWAGSPKAILSLGLVIAPLAIGCVHRWRPAAYLAALMAGELVLVLGIAQLVDRPVPAVARAAGELPGSAFPAGSAAASVCLFGALAVILVPRTRRGGWLRRATFVVVIAAPAGVAVAGVYRGAYRPMDVAGAVALALLWLAAATFVLDPNVDLHQPPALPLDEVSGAAPPGAVRT